MILLKLELSLVNMLHLIYFMTVTFLFIYLRLLSLW